MDVEKPIEEGARALDIGAFNEMAEGYAWLDRDRDVARLGARAVIAVTLKAAADEAMDLFNEVGDAAWNDACREIADNLRALAEQVDKANG